MIEDIGCYTGGPRLNHGVAVLGWKYHSNEEIARCFQHQFVPELQRNGGVGYFGIECGGEIFWCFDDSRLTEGGRRRKGDRGSHRTGRNFQNIQIDGFGGAMQHIGGDNELQIHKVTLVRAEPEYLVDARGLPIKPGSTLESEEMGMP